MFIEEEILMGYVINEQNTDDEFYFCSTPELKNEVWNIWETRWNKLRKILIDKYTKYPGSWYSLNSDLDIEQMQEDQRYRSLFEVEIETKFPVISEQTKFRNRNADDVRDGYVEILPYRETFDNTVKTRVHASSQITPSKKTVSVQTVCTFPTHKWTQYGYEYEPPVEVPIIVKKGQPKPKTPLEKFLSSSGVEPIYDEMVYNSMLNLYKDDYPDLCTDEYSSKSSQNLEFNEFMSFADVINCQDKLIEACSWHHSWSGIVALSYVDASTSSRLQSKPSRDEVYR